MTAAGLAGRSAEAGQSPIWRFLPVIAIIGGLALGYALGIQHYLSLDFLAQSRVALKNWAAQHLVLAPALFVVVYALFVALSFPAASVLTVFAGFLFGWAFGGVLAVVAATLGATALFIAARTAFGSMLQARVGSWGARLAEGFRRDAFGYLLVLRLAPFFPFFAVNVAPAFFDVRLRTYVAATFIGIMPGAFAYAWLGTGLDSVLREAAGSGHSVRLADLVTPELTIAFAALAGVAAVAAVVKRRWAAPLA
ncbi:MAG: TVP38/TMEM64 family protein [Methylobacterium mesophilicum]|nr:TVP38/TMEM64 family protein [Methylobacterium mesophilicum]